MNKSVVIILILAILTVSVSSCTKDINTAVSETETESSGTESSLSESASKDESIYSQDDNSSQEPSAEESTAESSTESFAENSDESSEEGSEESSEESHETSSESSSESSSENGSEDPYIFEQEGILIVGNRGMEKFYGSEASALSYSQCVQNIKNSLGDSINVYSMVAPHASVYYAPKAGQYSHLLTVGKNMHDFLKENAGDSVVYVDVYGALAAHTDEDIFFRTEHHWAALGAYYAAKEFARMAGVDFPDISEYEEHIKTGFVGSLYSFSGKAQILKDNPDEVAYYVNREAEYTAYYCYENNFDFDNYDFKRNSILFDMANYAAFLGGDGYGIKIETNNNTGRTLVILKDSYGNAVVPFLLSSYDTIYVLDFRYFKRNCCDFAREVGATDVLVIASGFTACGTIWKKLEAMRTMD
ncbi:MAG: DHHW family protein [Eubacteriales bacterium]|nr:DHHW family protein [Eubacteriales bacterium]